MRWVLLPTGWMKQAMAIFLTMWTERKCRRCKAKRTQNQRLHSNDEKNVTGKNEVDKTLKL